MHAPVALIRTERYSLDDVCASIERGIDLIGGISPLKERGQTLLLKPNMLAGADPARAVTTHPVFFEAAIIYFKSLGFKLIAGDSPAVESTSGAGKKTGLHAVAKRHGVKWSDFSGADEMPNPDGKLIRRFKIARAFTEADSIVTLPKLKTHSQMYYTGALKNSFGFIPGLEKSRFHLRFPDRERFARMIVDLNLLIRPTLSIMDAITAMEGPGPRNGSPINVNAVLASYDPLALDTAACRMVGYDPLSIPILRHAYGTGAWINSPDEIEIAGDSLESFTAPFRKIEIVKRISFIEKGFFSFLAPLAKRAFIPRPVIMHHKCIVCGRCVQICQAQALTVTENASGKKPLISVNYDRCIRCYCCHEVCPADAIELRKGWRN